MTTTQVLANLRTPLTTFVGRQSEMREVAARLGRSRLVTITGVGGAGKSRLALEVARSVQANFRDGVWLVELANITDPAGVGDLVAARFRASPVGRTTVESLVSLLEDRELLLILDNCEHLVAAVAEFATGLLLNTDGLSILTTSRERLNVGGEVLWRVPGLRLPPQSVEDVPALAEFDAIRLFCDRAGAVEPGFGLSPQNAHSIAGICRGLDGMPLAIELAAAQVGTRGVEAVSSGIRRPLSFLVGTSRDAAERHRTLRSVVNWSYALLTDAEQRVFDRLSLFASGFRYETALALCADGGDEAVVADALDSLIDKSLISTESLAEGSPRYRLLEPLREFGAEQLANSGEKHVYQARHAELMLALVEEAWPKFRSAEPGQWLEQMEKEHGNIRAALQFLTRSSTANCALALARAVAPFRHLRAHHGEGRRWLQRALFLESTSFPLRLNATSGATLLSLMQVDADDPANTFEEGTTSPAGARNDAWSLAYALNSLALDRFHAGDLTGAEKLLRKSLAYSERVGELWLAGWSLTFLCLVEVDRENFELAAVLGQDAVDRHEAIGELESLCWAACLRGAAACRLGELEVARHRIGQGLRGFYELEGRWGLSMGFSIAAHYAAALEKWEVCAQSLAVAEALRETLRYSVVTQTPFLGRWEPIVLAEARQAIGNDAVERAWSIGRRWPLERAYQAAVELLGLSRAPVSRPAAADGPPPSGPSAPEGLPPSDGEPPDTTSSTVARVSSPMQGILTRNGEYWTVVGQGPAIQVRDSLGLHYLACLVAAPDREFSAFELALADGSSTGTRPASVDAGPVLDAAATANYRRRIADLTAELEEAERFSDIGRVERARAELDALTYQLKSAFGLGGRARRTSSDAERFRINVTKAIRSTIRRIAQHDHSLGQHLDHSIRTGTFCSYSPDPAVRWTWQT